MFFSESPYPSPLEGKLFYGKQSINISYIATLYRDYEHFCSGSLISVLHVLTAAVCLGDFFSPLIVTNFSLYHALIGSSSVLKGGIPYYFEQVEIHKDFDFVKPGIINNIGLITVFIVSY